MRAPFGLAGSRGRRPRHRRRRAGYGSLGLGALWGICAVGSAVLAAAPPAPHPVVEAEEDVYQYQSADNGAGPMWCHGSTCLVRLGDEVFASGLETLKDAQPLNNCRWLLFHRDRAGWRQVQADPSGRTREPCPLAVLAPDRIVLSANSTLVPVGQAGGGPARPELLVFPRSRPGSAPTTWFPEWADHPQFSEHSYRSLAADGLRGELILFQNIGYTHAEWAFRDARGYWSARGRLKWPWGADYAKPEPIRVCYPNVALKNGAVYFVGVSDVLEPNPEWRAYKRQLTGQEWDYDFRRLYYTWTPDIRTGKFRDWIELASRERTCGWISPGDLWVAPDGSAHIIWIERALDERLRSKFFSEARQSHALEYAVIREGRVVRRRTLLRAAEGGPNEIPSAARFQATPNHRLFVLFYVSGRDPAGKAVSEDRILELGRDGAPGPAVRVPFQRPFTFYFTATVRAGSAPSTTLDLLGQRRGSSLTMSYARVRLR